MSLSKLHLHYLLTVAILILAALIWLDITFFLLIELIVLF